MRALVTGATGFIGYHVARLLQTKGFSVRAFVRSESDTTFLRDFCELIPGDVRDSESLSRAMKDCKHVYHVAADYRYWVPDVETIYAINVQGTINVMKAALESSSVEKIVYTSTAGVITAGARNNPSNEENIADFHEMVNHYKKSKFLAEQAVYAFIEKGLPVVIVNPTTVIGLFDRKPTPSGQIIVNFLNGKVPAYLDTGLNFVDVEDVAAGHVLAAELGRVGQRYILGNRNMPLKVFFECLGKAAKQNAPKIRLPYFPVLIAAHVSEALSKWVTHSQPRILLGSVKMAKKYMYFDSSKAVKELQMPQSPIETAIEKAMRWYRDHGYIRVRSRCSG